MGLQHDKGLSGLLILAGPTASGKTGLALALAQTLRADGLGMEIISVDSALVYRGMDIGTAKPSAQEQAVVPHHLIDIREPHETYSAAEFVKDAQALIAEIQLRGHLPMLVGGTMLYIHALLRGMDELPQADPRIRHELADKAAQLGWPGMHAWLQQVDAVTAQRLAPNDSQRIGRALEVWLSTGQPLSALQTRQSASDEWLQKWLPEHLVSLEPLDRAWLHQRIAQRYALMEQQGFLAEVKALREKPELHADLPSMRCVGYRQAWQMLDGEFTQAELPERVAAATRQLAKRQVTWLRGLKARRILPCDAENRSDQLEILKTMALKAWQEFQ